MTLSHHFGDFENSLLARGNLGDYCANFDDFSSVKNRMSQKVQKNTPTEPKLPQMVFKHHLEWSRTVWEWFGHFLRISKILREKGGGRIMLQRGTK